MEGGGVDGGVLFVTKICVVVPALEVCRNRTPSAWGKTSYVHGVQYPFLRGLINK